MIYLRKKFSKFKNRKQKKNSNIFFIAKKKPATSAPSFDYNLINPGNEWLFFFGSSLKKKMEKLVKKNAHQ